MSPLHLPPKNIEEAYNFVSLLFTAQHPSTQSMGFAIAHLTLELQKIKFQHDQEEIKTMPRMRVHVTYSLVEPRTKSKFDRAGATELEACAQNIHGARIEEIDWSRHWENFTMWGMEDGMWKEEKNILEMTGVQHFLGAPQVADFGVWK
jgi:hypothetical protein